MNATSRRIPPVATFIAALALVAYAPGVAAHHAALEVQLPSLEEAPSSQPTSEPCVTTSSSGASVSSDCLAAQFHIDRTGAGGPDLLGPALGICVRAHVNFLGFSMHECFGVVLA